MFSASSVYSAQPAVPILADALLRESESTGTADSHVTEPSSDWSLKEDWLRGIQSSKEAIFRTGVVLGFSRLRMRSMESNDYITQVSLIPRNCSVLSETNIVKASSASFDKAIAEYHSVDPDQRLYRPPGQLRSPCPGNTTGRS